MPTHAASIEIARVDLMGYLLETPLTQRFLGDEIAPAFVVPSKSGTFKRMPLEAMLSRGDVKRAKNGGYNASDHELEEDTFACKEYGHKSRLDDDEALLYNKQGNYDQIKAARLRNILMVEREIRLQGTLHNTTTFPLSGNTGKSISVEWDTSATCDPMGDVADARSGIRARGGATNNLILQCSDVAWGDLWRAESVLERFKYVVAGKTPDPTDEAARREMARHLGVKNILVGEALYNSAKDGATPVVADVWDDEYAVVFNAPTGGDISEPCAMRTFVWEEGEAGGLFTVEEYRDPDTRANMLRVRQHVQEKLLLAAEVYLLGNVHT
jgi:hypothetical protein